MAYESIRMSYELKINVDELILIQFIFYTNVIRIKKIYIRMILNALNFPYESYTNPIRISIRILYESPYECPYESYTNVYTNLHTNLYTNLHTNSIRISTRSFRMFLNV